MTTQILYPSSWSPSGGGLTGSLSGAPPQGTLASTSSTEFYYTGTGFTKTAPWTSYTITVVVAAGQVVPGMNDLTGVYTASSMVVEYFNGTSWNPLLSVDTG